MRVALIAAVAENGVIGRDGDMPWRIPGELRHFKRLTLGKPIVMGRRTFESLPGALPGRHNIVISRDPAYRAPGATVTSSLEAALALAGEIAARDGVGEVMVIGGAEVYRQALPRACRVYLTEVHQAFEGDTRFPDFDRTEWRELSREAGPAGAAPPHSFVVLERQGAAPATA